VKHKIVHGLDHATARRATRRALESYQAAYREYQPGGSWLDEDRAQVWFVVAGRRLEGKVQVSPTEVLLDLEVPLLFRPFQGVAVKIVDDEVRAWIARAKRGELG
jgi:hypothetical protein